MTADIATLQIRIDSMEAREAARDLERLRTAGGGAETATNALTGAFMRFAGPAALAAAAVAGFKKSLDVQREFDGMNSSLITATGSIAGAAQAFQSLQRFAATTPNSLAETTKAFIQMRNLGLDPSEAAMRSYGNTASAMGKSLNQMVEAVADAATGEFERLKEFGIKAKQNGDQVALTFQGVTTSIGNNAKEIEKYLQNLGNTKFAGGMALQAATLDGAISNLGDTWNQTFLTISQSGLGAAMQSGVMGASGALEDLGAIIKALTGEIDKEGKAVKESSLLHRGLTLAFEAFAVTGNEVSLIFRAISGDAEAAGRAVMAAASGSLKGARDILVARKAEAAQDRIDTDARTTAILGAADKQRKYAADLAAFQKANGYDGLAQYRMITTAAEDAAQASNKFLAIAEKNQSKQVKMAKEIAEAEKLGIAAGKSRAEIEKVIADIRAKGGTDKVASSIKAEATAYQSLVTSIREKLAASKLELIGYDQLSESQKLTIKLDADIAAGKISTKDGSIAKAQALIAEVGANEKLAASNKLIIEQAEEMAKIQAEYADRAGKSVESAIKEAEATEELVRTFGMTKTAIGELTLVRMEEDLARMRAIDGADDEVAALERVIDAKRRSVSAGGQLENMEAAKKASDDMASDWQKSVDQYEDVFRKGFAGMVNGGKGAWKSFTTSLATTFKTSVADQIYKMFAQPFIVKMVASLLGVVGGGAVSGAAQAAAGGGGSAASSMAGSFASSALGSITLGGSTIAAIGSSVATGVSAGMAGTSVAGAASAYGAAGMTGVSTGLTAGSAVGTALAAIPYLNRTPPLMRPARLVPGPARVAAARLQVD